MCTGSLREWCTSDKTLSLINDAVVDLVELHVENGAQCPTPAIILSPPSTGRLTTRDRFILGTKGPE